VPRRRPPGLAHRRRHHRRPRLSSRLGNRPGTRPLNPASVNVLLQHAAARAGLDPAAYSAHSLRAGFVTYAHLRGASDRAIAHQTRHQSLAILGQYVRVAQAWDDCEDPSLWARLLEGSSSVVLGAA